jgi:hypothetical protein
MLLLGCHLLLLLLWGSSHCWPRNQSLGCRCLLLLLLDCCLLLGCVRHRRCCCCI